MSHIVDMDFIMQLFLQGVKLNKMVTKLDIETTILILGLNFISLYKFIHITTYYKHVNKSLLIYTKRDSEENL